MSRLPLDDDGDAVGAGMAGAETGIAVGAGVAVGMGAVAVGASDAGVGGTEVWSESELDSRTAIRLSNSATRACASDN